MDVSELLVKAQELVVLYVLKLVTAIAVFYIGCIVARGLKRLSKRILGKKVTRALQ